MLFDCTYVYKYDYVINITNNYVFTHSITNSYNLQNFYFKNIFLYICYYRFVIISSVPLLKKNYSFSFNENMKYISYINSFYVKLFLR